MKLPDKDFICVDGEIKTVSNEVTNYIDFLVASISKYNLVLQQVQMCGVQDEVIRAKLMNLSTLLNSYKKELNEISRKYSSYYKGYLKDFESNDKFVFPGEEITAMEALIKSFF